MREFLGSEVETFRFEEGLQAPLARMAEWLGVAPPESLPHDLRPDPLEIAWDQVDRIRVRDHYARDFETLGYRTDQAGGRGAGARTPAPGPP